MQDIIDPTLHRKISRFLERKAREYPDLDLTNEHAHDRHIVRPRHIMKLRTS